jgi:putative modified peptide
MLFIQSWRISMSFQLPAEIASTLLDKLGSDDQFRNTFACDPRAALASLGFVEAADPSISRGIWMCMTVNELASKAVIQAGAAEMKVQLAVKAGVYSPFVLEARPAVKVA